MGLASFTGRHEGFVIDSKNRLTIPSRWRDAVRQESSEDGFYVAQLENSCLFLYSPKRWKIVADRIDQMPPSDKKRQLQRLFFSEVDYCPCDKNGRIVIDRERLDSVGIKRDVALVGASERVEVWSVAGWREFRKSKRKELTSIARGVL